MWFSPDDLWFSPDDLWFSPDDLRFSSDNLQFSSDDLEWAAAIVGRWVPPTPQYVWPLLAAEMGTEVWVKHGNHTPTGAFKVRGGLVYAERLRRHRPSVKGLVSATRGNHGQSVAFAGRAAGLDVTIVVPDCERGCRRRGHAAPVPDDP